MGRDASCRLTQANAGLINPSTASTNSATRQPTQLLFKVAALDPDSPRSRAWEGRGGGAYVVDLLVSELTRLRLNCG